MKKILLSMALVLCTAGAMAQSNLEFTFNRSENTVTAKLDGEVAEEITATIAINPTTYLTTFDCANDSILAINRNTTGATEADPNTYTLTINGLGNCTFTGITVGGVAVNSEGKFQGMDTNRDRNFVIGYGADANNLTNTTPAIKRICDNSHCNGNPTDHLFAVEGTANGNLVIKVQIYTDGGSGCFYGLTSISINGLTIEEAPEPLVKTGQFYTINLTPGYTATDRAGASMYVHSDAKLRCNKITGDVTAKNVFIFEEGEDGNIYMKNVATQTYISAIGSNASQDAISADSETTEGALEISFGELGEKTVDGNTVKIIEIQPGNNAMLNCGSIDGTGLGRVVSFTPGNDKINKASAWYLTEVTDFKYTLEVGTAQWATVVLGFNATIPTENFKAYTIASEEDGYVTLEEVAGVLAANVPVIVNATPGNYDFVYTTETATVTSSRLQGTLYNKDITATGAYVLSYIDTDEDGIKDEVGFYIATTTGKAEGTFTNNANKAYFVPTNAQANIASYSFRFGEGTTGVEKVEMRNLKSEIYDLTGRRVENITAPGIYVVNGKKVLVK